MEFGEHGQQLEFGGLLMVEGYGSMKDDCAQVSAFGCCEVTGMHELSYTDGTKFHAPDCDRKKLQGLIEIAQDCKLTKISWVDASSACD